MMDPHVSDRGCCCGLWMDLSEPGWSESTPCFLIPDSQTEDTAEQENYADFAALNMPNTGRVSVKHFSCWVYFRKHNNTHVFMHVFSRVCESREHGKPCSENEMWKKKKNVSHNTCINVTNFYSGSKFLLEILVISSQKKARKSWTVCIPENKNAKMVRRTKWSQSCAWRTENYFKKREQKIITQHNDDADFLEYIQHDKT